VKTPTEVTIDAPAKINLGLEILRKRDDGYHDIRTAMAMLELADTLTVFVDLTGQGAGMSDVSRGENLIVRALDAFREAVPESPPLGWRIEKRIPMAAGLGGASSDAAAALIAANRIAGMPCSRTQLETLARELGSDISFFLGSPLAIASGRGDILDPLIPTPVEVLLVVPKIDIPQKTGALYSLIGSADYTDGGQADVVREHFAAGQMPPGQILRNAFNRPLATIEPRVLELRQAMSDLGADSFGLSGAGPAFYVLSMRRNFEEVRKTLVERFGDWITLVPTRTRQLPLRVVDVNSRG